MFQLPFERLGIFNWFINNALDFRFKKFHLITPQERADHLEQAVQRFEDAYNDSDNHNRLVYDYETDERVRKRHSFELKKGRTMARLYIIEPNGRKRMYAFIDINMKDPERYGGMMKPATYKAPEPKRYIRAHLFAQDPLRGATWYGPDYMDGGKKGDESKRIRDNWFRGAFAEESKWGV